MKVIKVTIILILSISSSLISCGASIALYDHLAYEQATSLKVDSLVLMDKAVEPYSDHAKEVEGLMIRIEKAYEYAKNRPQNDISAKQWEILKNPERNLLGGFFKRWKEKNTFNKTFIDETKKLVGDAFDTISGLESGKINPSNIK